MWGGSPPHIHSDIHHDDDDDDDDDDDADADADDDDDDDTQLRTRRSRSAARWDASVRNTSRQHEAATNKKHPPRK